MIPSVTETWTVIANGQEIWSSAANDETSAAADRAARENSGRVLRATYTLADVQTEVNYSPLPTVLSDRNALRDELFNAHDALSGDSNDAEHEALIGLSEVVARCLDLPPWTPTNEI